MFSRYGQFVGGIDLPEEKQATLGAAITMAAPPARLCVPLAMSGRDAAEPSVSPGEVVAPGRRIARGRGNAADVFAPLGGTVGRVGMVSTVAGRLLYRTPALELRDLQPADYLAPPEPIFDVHAAADDALWERLSAAHLPMFRPPAETLLRWLTVHRQTGCEHLVVNAMENQPYVTASHRLLVEFGPEVLQGAAVVARALGVRREKTILAVDSARTGAYRDLLAPAEEFGISTVALPRRYPVGADVILLKVLLRKEVPCGGRPKDIRAAVLDPMTCLAVRRWTVCEQRLLGQVLTLSGPRAETPGNVFVPFGVNCQDLLCPSMPPIVLGGPMRGVLSRDDTVTGPGLDAILALTPTPLGSAAQCIRCGWCRDHCPTRLNVAVLNDFYEHDDIAQAAKLGVLSCLDCGVCSYICPARLPLTERMGRLKAVLRAPRAANAEGDAL